MDINFEMDLDDQSDSFKKWFHDEINKAVETKIFNKNVLVNMLLNIDHKIDEDFSCNNKIFQLLMSDKAFNTINEEHVKEPENVIRFLTESMSDLYEKNKGQDELEGLEKIDFINDTNIETNEIWSSLLEMIANFSKWLTYFAKGCPGFHIFDNDDLSIQVASSVSFLFCVRYRKLAKVNDKSFLILSNNRNILMSKEKSVFFSAENLSSLSFLFHKILNELELTECELAVLYPVVLLGCDANLVKNKEYLIDLRSYYVKTLLNQFRINNRDENFSRKLNCLFKTQIIRELNKHNFRYPKSK